MQRVPPATRASTSGRSPSGRWRTRSARSSIECHQQQGGQLPYPNFAYLCWATRYFTPEGIAYFQQTEQENWKKEYLAAIDLRKMEAIRGQAQNDLNGESQNNNVDARRGDCREELLHRSPDRLHGRAAELHRAQRALLGPGEPGLLRDGHDRPGPAVAQQRLANDSAASNVATDRYPSHISVDLYKDQTGMTRLSRKRSDAMAFDLTAHMKAMSRTVRNLERDGKPAKAVVASCTYDTDPADLWDALTNPKRLPRWFAPVTGDLKLGGKYQVEGNAGGTITECEPREAHRGDLGIHGRDELGQHHAHPEGRRAPSSSSSTSPSSIPTGTSSAPAPSASAGTSRFLGLAMYLADPDCEEAAETTEAGPTGREAKDFIRDASDGWGQAAIGAGEDRTKALEAAESTRKFYTGEAPPPGDVMHAFDVLGDPVRRRILELLCRRRARLRARSSRSSSASSASPRPPSRQHLKVLRDSGFADVRAEGPRRIYTLDPAPLREVDAWLDHFRGFWTHKLEALDTEIARGKKERGEP